MNPDYLILPRPQWLLLERLTKPNLHVLRQAVQQAGYTLKFS